MGKRIFERWWDDHLYPVEVDRDSMLVSTGDMAGDAGRVAANIGLIAELIGDYARRYAVADAEYRHWRAMVFVKAKAGGGAKPLSDDLAAKMVEADPDFLKHKAELAELEGDLEYLRGIFDGLRSQAQLVKARVDLNRGKEIGEGAGFDLRDVKGSTAAVTSVSDNDRAAAVRAAMMKARV